MTKDHYFSWNLIGLFLRIVVLLLLSLSVGFAAEIPKQFDWNDKYVIEVELKESQMIYFMSDITIRVKEKSTQQLVFALAFRQKSFSRSEKLNDFEP